MTRRWSTLARKSGRVRYLSERAAADRRHPEHLYAGWGEQLADEYEAEARWWARWAPWWPT